MIGHQSTHKFALKDEMGMGLKMPFGGTMEIFRRWACRFHPKVTIDRDCTKSELELNWKRIRINLWSDLSEPEEVLYVV